MTETKPLGETPRPLWRRIVDFPLVAMCIAVGLMVGTIWLGSLAVKQIPQMGIPTASRQMIAGLAVAALVILVYKLAIRRLGETPRDDMRGEHALRDLGLGLIGGTLLFSVVTAVAALAGVYDIVGWGSTKSIFYALVLMGIVPAVIEETLFRGILFRHLELFGGTWFGLILSSVLFGLAHFYNPNSSLWASSLIALEAGILLGGAYMLTRSLWAPIGLHAAWNFTQGEIFDVPVSGIDQNGLVQAKMSGPEWLSGGSFGLEASVISLIIATAAGVWMAVRAARAGYLVQPWWVRRRLASQEAIGIDVDRDADLGPPVDPA